MSVTYTSACGCSYQRADVPGAANHDIRKCERHKDNYSDRQVLLVATFTREG